MTSHEKPMPAIEKRDDDDSDHASSPLSVHKGLNGPEGQSGWALVPVWPTARLMQKSMVLAASETSEQRHPAPDVQGSKTVMCPHKRCTATNISQTKTGQPLSWGARSAPSSPCRVDLVISHVEELISALCTFLNMIKTQLSSNITRKGADRSWTTSDNESLRRVVREGKPCTQNCGEVPICSFAAHHHSNLLFKLELASRW